MRIGILAERDLPETHGLEDAVFKAGHTSRVIHYPDLSVMSGGERGISLIGDPEATKVDYIIPYIDRHIQTGNRILSALINLGKPSYLHHEKIQTARNKLLAQLAFGSAAVRHPASADVPLIMPQDPIELGNKLNEKMREVEPEWRKKVVVKGLYGTMGDEVWKLNRKDARIKAAELLAQNVEFMFQQAIPKMPGEKFASDKGIFVCGGKVVTSFRRIAKKDDFRANLAKGGTGKPYIPNDEEVETALSMSKALSIRTGRADIMDSEDGLQALEFNVFPGSQIVDITKVPVFELYVADALDYFEQARHELDTGPTLVV